jgi:hypothetical protein
MKESVIKAAAVAQLIEHSNAGYKIEVLNNNQFSRLGYSWNICQGKHTSFLTK